jgi:tight adherence protein B
MTVDRTLIVAVVLLSVLGLVAGGPVGGFVVAVYAILAARAFLRRSQRRRDAAARARTLDDLSGLAADLRAGLPPNPRPALAPADRVTRLTSSVWRLAERTGAPAADLVERIEADARDADRARATAMSQAAGVYATGMLLALLPLAGLGLGMAMGLEPFGKLLHTSIGGACAIAAVLLQAAGLIMIERLVSAVLG